MMKTIRAALVALALGGVVLACESSSSPVAPSPAAPTMDAVVFSADFTALTAAGTRTQLTAIGVMSNGMTRDVTATCTNWFSTNPGALTISSSGMLTAQSDSGSATITMTCQGITARGLVTLNARSTFTPTPGPRRRIGATCMDGSESGSTAGGTCSSHGGVKCWHYSDGTCTNP